MYKKYHRSGRVPQRKFHTIYTLYALTKFMFARRVNVPLYARCRAPPANKNYAQIKLLPRPSSTVKLNDDAVYIRFYLEFKGIDNPWRKKEKRKGK